MIATPFRIEVEHYEDGDRSVVLECPLDLFTYEADSSHRGPAGAGHELGRHRRQHGNPGPLAR